MVDGQDINLGANATLNGNAIMTASNCQHGEVLSFDANLNEWTCASFAVMLDSDNDGVLAWNDCNDNDPTQLGQSNDADCDGHITADDCNDNDANSNHAGIDGDCDGVLHIFLFAFRLVHFLKVTRFINFADDFAAFFGEQDGYR